MNKINNLISQGSLIALAVMFIFFSTQAHVFGKDAYKLVMKVGTVNIITAGKTRTAIINQYLGGSETIVTGKNSLADISMSGKGYMRIQENSKVAVASLKKAAGDPDLNMSSGKVILIMSKLSKGNRYNVGTSTTVASVRGTIFQVSGDESKTDLDVFTGQVLVNPVSGGVVQSQIAEMVSEGQSLSLDKVLVTDILAKKKKITLSALRSEVKDAFMKQAVLIRETPEFKKLNLDVKTELDQRIQKINLELKDKNLDRNSLKDKLKEERDKLLDKIKSPKGK
jgi:hypothetical protein